MVTHVFSNFQVPKNLEKKLSKNFDFVLFWNVSIWDGINKRVHILNYFPVSESFVCIVHVVAINLFVTLILLLG